jgi:protein dithiol oxidoreductase (disulfide-forming)
MKSLLPIAVLLMLGLAACGQDNTNEKAAQPLAAPAQEEPAAAGSEIAPAAEVDAVADEERPQTVEESGGEPDPADNADKPIILAQTATAAANQEWKFKEGEHYHRLVPTQPTLGGADKVEVAEFFWYGCGHCFEFEPYINAWSKTIPANARFVRIPAMWNPLVTLHAQLYYTEQALVNTSKIKDPESFRAAVFTEYHRRGNRLTSKDAIEELFARFDISADDFNSTWNSFEVAQKLRIAQDLARRYAVTGVPTMVVNGKYRSGKAEMKTYPKLLELMDELIARETVH